MVENGYVKLNVELYGGALLAPWFDRPLSVAGRLIVKEDEQICEKLVTVDKDMLMIPNLAIHMLSLIHIYGNPYAEDRSQRC